VRTFAIRRNEKISCSVTIRGEKAMQLLVGSRFPVLQASWGCVGVAAALVCERDKQAAAGQTQLLLEQTDSHAAAVGCV
jgi:hypothetical protein